MADPVVHITNGLPDSGTGNITTLGQTLTDGANATLGANADAVSATGSISAKLRALVTAIGTTAWDLGVGTGGSRTQRIAIDTASQNANGQATMANSTPTVLPSDFVGTSGFMKKEDVPSADGDAGIPAMAVRKATPANTSGTDGDYEFLQVSAGRLWVSDTPALTNFGAGEYETVAASQTAQALGATGATGDYISGILVIPATTSPGVVTLLDNATSIPVFVGGATSVSNLVPFFIPLGMISVSGAWKITTGANVSCIGIGNFT